MTKWRTKKETNTELHQCQIGALTIILLKHPYLKNHCWDLTFCINNGAWILIKESDINTDNTRSLEDIKEMAILEVRDYIYEIDCDLDNEIKSWKKKNNLKMKPKKRVADISFYPNRGYGFYEAGTKGYPLRFYPTREICVRAAKISGYFISLDEVEKSMRDD